MAHNFHSAATEPQLPHFPQIIKLDRSNYSYWRAQALAAIRAHGFHDFIRSDVTSPAQFHPTTSATTNAPIPNPAYAQWIRRDQFLLSWLLSSIGESMLGHVVRSAHAKDLWFVLDRLFRSQSKARIMQLRSLLQTTKKGDLSVEDYFLKMQGYADQLSAVGHVVSDEELIMYILAGFGLEYEALVVNVMQAKDTQSVQEIQFAFQAYENRILQHNSAMFTSPTASMFVPPSANVAYRGNSGYGRGNPGNSSRGGGVSRGGFARGASTSKVVCQLCGRTGHVAIKCFKRFDVYFTENSVAQQAFLAENMEDIDEGDSNWYVDSGATAHVTNDLANLQLSTNYHGPDNLMVGNGSNQPQDPSEGHTPQ